MQPSVKKREERILIFGGGGIASRGIVPVVGGEIVRHKECDVTVPQQVSRVMGERGGADVVIVTAGVSHPDPEGWGFEGDPREVLVNLVGSMNVAAIAAQYHVDKIILIGSVAGKYGKPNHTGYSASKAGVISVAQSLAMEGNKAYCISPGRVDTPMRDRDYPQDSPGSRLEPQEIGGVVRDILDEKYKPGDNIIIRRIGLKTAPIKVDKGEPWKTELRVGKPVTI